jgi:hypothetical protein
MIYMEVDTDMELSKKTTILLSPDLHEDLTRIAAQRGVSLGHLVREACREKYGLARTPARKEAVEKLADLELPVGSVGEMKRESVPDLRPGSGKGQP